MKWTKNKPTEEGWYWYQEGEYMPECVSVLFTGSQFEATSVGMIVSPHLPIPKWEPLDNFKGKWGDQPIPEPEE